MARKNSFGEACSAAATNTLTAIIYDSPKYLLFGVDLPRSLNHSGLTPPLMEDAESSGEEEYSEEDGEGVEGREGVWAG